MKANRKSIHAEDEAVSPVIAVILMVAITVVLAATVYVWVSGFSGKNSDATASLSLSKSQTGKVATLTIASNSPGLRWNELKFIATGPTNYVIVTSGGDASTSGILTPSSTATVNAGDRIYIANGDTTEASSVSLQVIDTVSNAVLADIKGMSLAASTSSASTTLSVERTSGSGLYVSGNTLVATFPNPILASSLALTANPSTDLTLSAGIFGTYANGARLAMISPTKLQITLGTDTTVAAGATLTVAAGAITQLHNGGTNFGALSGSIP